MTNHGSLLVVDDDKNICEAMADYLRSLGHRTETALTCGQAIDRMEEYPFEVVVCDVNLPDNDGFHLLEWATKHKPDTSVILLTGYGTIESAVEAIRIGNRRMSGRDARRKALETLEAVHIREPERVAELNARYAQIEGELASALERWEALEGR